MSGSDCTDLDHCECVDSLYERVLNYSNNGYRITRRYLKNES
jgi:hypothetical protein